MMPAFWPRCHCPQGLLLPVCKLIPTPACSTADGAAPTGGSNHRSANQNVSGTSESLGSGLVRAGTGLKEPHLKPQIPSRR